MWIHLNDSFISVVQHNIDPHKLHVRARKQGDLETLFEKHLITLNDAPEITHTPDRDYLYRADVARGDFATMMASMALSIDYPNFKASIPQDDHARHNAYMDAWAMMRRWQRQESGEPVEPWYLDDDDVPNFDAQSHLTGWSE